MYRSHGLAACLLCTALLATGAEAQQLNYYEDAHSSRRQAASIASEIEAAQAGYNSALAGCDEPCGGCSDGADACTPDSCTGRCDCGISECGGCDSCRCCDKKKQEALAAAVKDSHKGVFYANSFDYLCDPCYDGRALGDALKRNCVGNWIVDVGGQYRMRLHREQNIRNSGAVPNGLGLTGNDDSFLLHRTRLYLNAERGRHFRFYTEMLDAESNYEDTNPRPIEVNRYELQNCFVELKGIEAGYGTLGARIGRQELIYGNQRLVSPLDWANTRRTFDAYKVMYSGDTWDVDGFYANLLTREFNQLDPPNEDRQLYGIYSTYKGLPSDNLELYWLALDFNDVGFQYDTCGFRYWGGSDCGMLFELEANYQFGHNADDTNHQAGSFTLGLGKKFADAKFSPTVWCYYDWASGADTVGNGYHHYQPLAHKYNGFMDIFGRRNLSDINVLATADLNKNLKLLVWYHYFSLVNENDVPYNVNMSPFAGLPAGSAGSRDLGHELDVVLTVPIAPRSSLLFGYSHFFAGDFYATTPGVPYNGDADFFYTQWHVNF